MNLLSQSRSVIPRYHNFLFYLNEPPSLYILKWPTRNTIVNQTSNTYSEEYVSNDQDSDIKISNTVHLSFRMAPKTIKDRVFSVRSKSIPPSQWAKLTAKTEGADLTHILEEWGADTKSSPVITILITVLEASSRVKGSRYIMRGPVFSATRNSPLKANSIWPGLDDDISVTFSIVGEQLNFANGEGRNFSFWFNLRTNPTFKMFRGEALLSPAEVDNLNEGVCKEGAMARVAVYPLSATHMSARLLVAPLSRAAIQEKASDWNMDPESHAFPAIDITDHWR